MGWPTGILIDASKGSPTDNNIRNGKLLMRNTVIAGSAKPIDYAASSTSATGWNRDSATNWFNTAGFGNSIFNTNDELKLTAAFNYANPDFTPQASSPLLNAASFAHPKISNWFTAVNFIGAVGPTGSNYSDWWKGWTRFN